MRSDVGFSVADGTVLRGFLYSSSRPAPGIVMCHGFSAVKEQIAHYAALFADAGFSVLLYDHRGFGTSDGAPRLEVDPWVQIADWRDAITWAAARPEFDAGAGFGIWGSSFAGGLAMVVAANDPRVRCLAIQIPNVSGHRNATQIYSQVQRRELARRVQLDRERRALGHPPAMIPAFTADPEELCVFPPAADPDRLAAAAAAAPTWVNEVTLRSAEHFMEFEPAGWAPYVDKPLLMVVAERDICTFPDVQRAVFDTVAGPKQLITHPGGHFDTYVEYFSQSGPPARDWFLTHLGRA